jgi:hypothetical protein
MSLLDPQRVRYRVSHGPCNTRNNFETNSQNVERETTTIGLGSANFYFLKETQINDGRYSTSTAAPPPVT